MRKTIYQKILSSSLAEIDIICNKDAKRTFKSKPYLKTRGHPGTRLVFNISKALGAFFPKAGYCQGRAKQGMNYVVGFLLEVSGLKEIETFDFLVELLKSPSRLFIGIYENNFPMVTFYTFMFYKVLQMLDKSRYEQVLRCAIPNEMWLAKWFITLFAGNTTKPFLLRIWDFLLVEDFMGPVYVALTIVLISKKTLFEGFEMTLLKIQKSEKLCECLDFNSFVKKLQTIKISTETKIELLKEYFQDLKGGEKKDFKELHDRLMIYLNRREVEERQCKWLTETRVPHFQGQTNGTRR